MEEEAAVVSNVTKCSMGVGASPPLQVHCAFPCIGMKDIPNSNTLIVLGTKCFIGTNLIMVNTDQDL